MSVIHAPPSTSLPVDMLEQARAEAERRFGDGPAPAWQPSFTSVSTRSRRRRLALGLAASGGVVLAAVVAALGWSTHDDPDLPKPRMAPGRADEVVDASSAAPVPARRVAAPPPALSSTLNITRRGSEWRVEAVGVSRLVAAQRLAQASGSLVLGDLEPLAAGRLLDLRWQGSDPAAAWQAVLGPQVSFALQCRSVRCRVWIVEAGAHDGSSPALAQHPPSVPAPSAAAAIDGAGATPPQSDSADARVAAHHD